MQIKNLANTELSEIVSCLVCAFEGYFVKMPDSVDYWRGRFKGARADFELSFGVFDKGELVAFIINGVDMHDGKLTAFNTGTGVIPSHRGQALVDKMYEFALPKLRAAKIDKCMLEVIEGNARAIRVYERIGFHIKRHFLCFRGEIEVPKTKVYVEAVELTEVFALENTEQHFYSWDNTQIAIEKAEVYQAYLVKDDAEKVIGHFVFNPQNNYVAQLEASTTNFAFLMAGIQQISAQIRVNNVDDKRTDYVQNLLKFGIENHINQYEMEWFID